MRIIAVTLVVSAVALVVRAQSPQVPTSARQTVTISGRVVADETGDPLPNARVSITSATLGTRVVLADGDGHFALTVPPDRYTVVAAKTGYVTGEATATGGQAIEIRLRRAAAISGRVIDEFGDPMPAVSVTAETVSDSTSKPVTVASTQTDDRGEYRLAGLRGGVFTVAVMIRRVTTPARAVAPDRIAVTMVPEKTYYPGVTTVNEAEALRLPPGEDRPGVDFVMPADEGPLPLVVLATLQADPSARGTAQNPTPGASGIIRGRVVSPDGRGVPRANVRLIGNTDIMQWRVTKADADGRFEFVNLAAGVFTLSAQKLGYSAIERGPGVPGSTRSIQLVDGETRERIDLALTRGGTLAGHVFDELGDPVQGASVQVLQVRYEAGRRRLVEAGGAARVTDDLGRYRLYRLMPGQYLVSATVGAVSPADLPGYARSYFPGTPNPAQAQFIAIGPQQDVGGIDFSLSRTRTVRVTGKSLNAAGEQKTANVWLVPIQGSTSVAGMRIGARLSPDGTFEFPDVPPGQYMLQASRDRVNSWTEGEFGAMPVSVGASDVTGLIFQTSAGSSIKGRLRFDSFNNSRTPASSDFELSAMPVDFDAVPSHLATANIHPDWSFELDGINGPRRLQLLGAPPGWVLKEIRVNGIDLGDRPLSFGRKNQSLTDVEVVLTDRINELSGTITDDRGGPVSGSNVIVFSTDRGRWYPASRFLGTVTARPDGTFMLAGLPFGTYYAAAIARMPVDGEDAWQDPEFLQSLLPRASTVTLGDGQKQSISLRLPAR